MLLTRFLSADGVAELSDFMPIEERGAQTVHDLVRRVKTVRGEVKFRMQFAPRFDYARADHRDRAGGRPAHLSLEGSGRDRGPAEDAHPHEG